MCYRLDGIVAEIGDEGSAPAAVRAARGVARDANAGIGKQMCFRVRAGTHLCHLCQHEGRINAELLTDHATMLRSVVCPWQGANLRSQLAAGRAPASTPVYPPKTRAK